MTAAAKKLLKSALELPRKDREKIAEVLFDSFDESEAEISPELRDELARRSAEIDAGKAEWSTWDEVKKRVYKKIGM